MMRRTILPNHALCRDQKVQVVIQFIQSEILAADQLIAAKNLRS